MASSPPKLRDDLTVSEQQTGGETVFVFKDPVVGQFFRMGEAERFIAGQCDGATPLATIRQRTEEKFGAALPSAALEAFVKKLEKAGLLETERATQPRRVGNGRFAGTALYCRFKLLDPDRLLDQLVRKVRFFFTPLFLIFSAAMILLAVGILTTNWADVGESFGRVYRASAIPWFLIMIFLVVSAHEFAHGLTCKRFGGEVKEMGLAMIYFQPAFYCNVSDAWLFPERSKRLWVGFAGPYFELFLWSVATVLWRLTDVETWINYLSFIVMTTSGIKTLLNFNPLIKMDGYYLLSDYLGIPNLRRKAYRYIGDKLRRVAGMPVKSTREVSQREGRIYLGYGLIATCCSAIILTYATVKAGGILIEQRQPMAFLLFSGLLSTKFRRRFRRLFGGASRRSNVSDPDDDGDDFDTPEVSEPSEPAEPKKKERSSRKKSDSSESGKKKRRAWKPWIQFGVLAGLASATLFLDRMNLRITAAFNVLPRENADVRAGVEGTIEQICVDEGDEVKVGDVIARLSDRDLVTDLRKAEADLTQTRARLRLLEAGPTEDEIEVAKTAVLKGEDRLKYAQARLARDKSLFEQNLLSSKEFEDTQERFAASESDLAEARSRLKVLSNGSRPEEIDAMKAEIDRLETQRQYLEEQRQFVKVVSPAAGIVATPSRQLKEMKRQLVKKGDLIAKVFDFKTVTAEMVIPEKEIADVKVGQSVLLKARAYPDEVFHGTVTSIATTAQGAGGQAAGGLSLGAAGANKAILVTTQIDNPSLLLKSEMSGQAKIVCGERRIIDLVTRRLARTLKVEFWSWW